MALRIGIVGLGGIGNIHARCYTANKDTEVVAVCDINKERADKAAEAYKAKAFYSVQEMLDSGIELDACSMATDGVERGSDHYQPTMELLAAGIPVLGEKPICNDIAKAREMVDLGKKKNVAYAIDLNHRFTPSYIRAKQWIDEGRLGQLNMINMTMWINNPNESSPWYHMRALHPHSFDIMRYFGGEAEKVQAFMRKGEGRTIWSNAKVNVLFNTGILGTLTGSYDSGGSYGLETCELIGSKGRVVINEACEKLTFYPRTSNQVESFDHLGGMQSFGDTFQSRINAWIEDLLKKTPADQVDGKGEDGLKAQLIIEAAIESWNTGQVVAM